MKVIYLKDDIEEFRENLNIRSSIPKISQTLLELIKINDQLSISARSLIARNLNSLLKGCFKV